MVNDESFCLHVLVPFMHVHVSLGVLCVCVFGTKFEYISKTHIETNTHTHTRLGIVTIIIV